MLVVCSSVSKVRLIFNNCDRVGTVYRVGGLLQAVVTVVEHCTSTAWHLYIMLNHNYASSRQQTDPSIYALPNFTPSKPRSYKAWMSPS